MRSLLFRQIGTLPAGQPEYSISLVIKAHLPAGAVQIAVKSGAELIPSFIWREGKYTHRQVIGKAIDLDRTGDKEEILEKNINKVLPVMEKYISEHISEWELFHDIWED